MQIDEARCTKCVLLSIKVKWNVNDFIFKLVVLNVKAMRFDYIQEFKKWYLILKKRKKFLLTFLYKIVSERPAFTKI